MNRRSYAGSANPNYRNAGHHICKTCNNYFHSYHKTRKYCSINCRNNDPEYMKNAIDRINKVKGPGRPKMIGPKARTCYCNQCSKTFYWGHKLRICPDCRSRIGMRTCVMCDISFKSHYRKTCSDECRRNWRSEVQKGNKSHRWQGGKTEYSIRIRQSLNYADWRRAIYMRDNYTCQMCDKHGVRLAAHHIKPVSNYPELILDIDNGITLCWTCNGRTIKKESEFEELLLSKINNLTVYVIMDSDEALRTIGAI